MPFSNSCVHHLVRTPHFTDQKYGKIFVPKKKMLDNGRNTNFQQNENLQGRNRHTIVLNSFISSFKILILVRGAL